MKKTTPPKDGKTFCLNGRRFLTLEDAKYYAYIHLEARISHTTTDGVYTHIDVVRHTPITTSARDALEVIGKYHDGKTIRETTIGELKKQFSDEGPRWFEWFFETLQNTGTVNTRFCNYSLKQKQ